MRHLKSGVEQYLKKIGRLEPVSLGDSEERRVAEEDSQFLIRLLDKRVAANNYLIITIVILLCVSFLVSIFILLLYRNDPATLKIVLGSTFLLALGIVKLLQRLWFEKSIMDISLTMLRKLPPEKAADFINTLYWSFIKGQSQVKDKLK